MMMLRPRRRRMHRTVLCLLLALEARSSIRNRFYVRKIALPPTNQSAWSYLYHSRDDLSMMTCTGFDYASFNRLHDLLFPPVPHADHPSTLNTHAKLGLILHYLNSSMMQKTLCQIFSATESIISRDLNYMLKFLGEKLPTIRDAQV